MSRKKPKFQLGEIVCVRDGIDPLTGQTKYNPARVISLPNDEAGWGYGLEQSSPSLHLFELDLPLGIFHTMDAKEGDIRKQTEREIGKRRSK